MGSPFSSKPLYARNVWDMQSFQGRLYLGHGNSSNLEPSPNAGPIPVVYWDPATSAFVSPYTVNEEQIDRYRIFDGQLYIPGHDPRDDTLLGNYYVFDQNGWSKQRNVPGGVHMLDLCKHQGTLFVALGSNGSTIFSSTNGTNWRSALDPVLAAVNQTAGRVFSFFEFGPTLHALAMVRLPSGNFQPTVLRYDTNLNWFVAEASSTVSNLFPNTPLPFGRFYRLERAVNLEGRLYYLLGRSYNDLQWESQGMYVAGSVQTGARVNLPAGSQAWDLTVNAGRVWALLSAPVSGSTNVWVQVSSSTDGTQWQELLHFESPTMARSFEWLGGDLYFGLGSNTNQPSNSTGQLLRVKKELFAPKLSARRNELGVEVSVEIPADPMLVIESSPDGQNWTPAFTNSVSGGSLRWIDDQLFDRGSRFFRVRLGP